VELGKTLAKPIIGAIRGDAALPASIDASTTGLVQQVRAISAMK